MCVARIKPSNRFDLFLSQKHLSTPHYSNTVIVKNKDFAATGVFLQEDSRGVNM